MTSPNGRHATSCRIGVDIGGTFTDVILVRPSGDPVALKILSTPPNFDRAVLEAVRRALEIAGLRADALAEVRHGTTVATNAILEGRGARTALVTTEGFRDVLEIGRMRRPRLYDIKWEKPIPLAPRRDRFELSHRLDARGVVKKEAPDVEIDELVQRLAAAEVESVAVCLINSYLAPDAEREVAAKIASRMPGVFVTASVDVSPEMREYERTSTAVVNAYVGPVVKRYVTDLRDALRVLDVEAELEIMQSSGGLLPATTVADRPVQIIESGPAAGVIAVQRLAAELELPNVIAFDMGGTTAKASLIENGRPFVAADYEVGGGINSQRGLSRGGGYAIRVPSIDIAEVGAGGGSVLWIDEGGSLRVGPESAGADPGPACYRRGGERPTLTDANVVLGYLSPTSLAGGTVAVDPELARGAVGMLAARLALDGLRLAYGAYTIAVTSMTKAVKAVTSERGRDPRDSALVAFGGAGPIYAAAMAAELGIRRVVVPPHPGLFSAVGLLVADLERQEVGVAPAKHQESTIEALFQELEQKASASLEARADHVEVDRLADLRYSGQRFELRIPVPGGRFGPDQLRTLLDRFHAEHLKTYGRAEGDELVELVNLRVTCRVPNDLSIVQLFQEHEGQREEPRRRRCYFRQTGLVQTAVVARFEVPTEPTNGPLIVEDMDATCVVPPDATVRRDPVGNLLIDFERSR